MYTPGPWRVEPSHAVDAEENEMCIVANTALGECRIANVYDVVGEHDSRLIAAAPELLAVCKALLAASQQDIPGIFTEVIYDAQQLVSKVEGVRVSQQGHVEIDPLPNED